MNGQYAHKKMYPLALIIREIQIMMTMRYHITPARMVYIQKAYTKKWHISKKNQCELIGMWENK